MDAQVPDDADLAALLDKYAPFQPAPLCPEISVFQGRSLVEIWEAAERLAGSHLPSPFWAYPWPAGCALARVLLDQPDYVRDRRVIELGAGGGVVSLAAAYAGGGVTANDVDPWALATLRIAARRQQLDVACKLADLTDQIGAVQDYDVILCSDMAYERRMTPKYDALMRHAKNRGKQVLVADAGRTYFVADGLELVADYDVAVPQDLEGVQVRRARVFKM